MDCDLTTVEVLELIRTGYMPGDRLEKLTPLINELNIRVARERADAVRQLVEQLEGKV